MRKYLNDFLYREKNASTSCKFTKLQREFCVLNRVHLKLYDGNYPHGRQNQIINPADSLITTSYMGVKRAMQSSAPPEMCFCIFIVLLQLRGRRWPALLVSKKCLLSQYAKLRVIVSTRVWPCIITSEFGQIFNSGFPGILSKRQHCCSYFQSLLISLPFPSWVSLQGGKIDSGKSHMLLCLLRIDPICLWEKYRLHEKRIWRH